MTATTPAVTFLFTDLEGSTRLWEAEPAKMAGALAERGKAAEVKGPGSNH